jgi:hypothetical protein
MVSATPLAWADDDDDENFSIRSAAWNADKSKLVVRGKGKDNHRVTVVNAFDASQTIGSDRIDDDKWRIRKKRPSPVPCRIRATSSDGSVIERDVAQAPADCSPTGPVNPPPNPVTLSIGNAGANENDGTLQFRISLSAAAPQSVSIDYATRNDGDAQTGVDGDYLETAGTLTIAAGQTGGSIDVVLINDDVQEADETFSLELSNPENALLGNARAVGTIVDDDDPVTPPPGPLMSINSTSANEPDIGLPASQVATPDLINNGTHALLVANDLGMHCADLDYQVFSILPPFNVIHAQIIQRGEEPEILDDSTMEIVYSAVSSDSDPALANLTAEQRGESVFKGNFWKQAAVDINDPASPTLPLWYQVYAPLYFGLLQPTDLDQDKGLPVPDSMKLAGNGVAMNCLEAVDPRAECQLAQALMPGAAENYVANDLKHFDRFDHDFNFFNGLLGGLGLGAVIPDTNWFSAEGVPIMPVDDDGRANAYPLMRVQAIDKASQQVVASTDLVLPVASEADCQSCHARALDCAEITQQNYGYTMACSEEGLDRVSLDALGGVMTLVGDNNGALPPGETLEQRLLNTAKINILRTHDAKHGTTLDSQRRVVCASCHYTPALDLAQLGPTDSVATEQTQHISMSRAMHGHHGDLVSKDNAGASLFPNMPAPNDPQRLEPVASHLDQFPLAAGSDLSVEEYVLQESCYSCHPGKRTDCLRGAMASAGIVCQDCHGDMLAVGDDFSADFPDVHGSIDPTKRVPWAVEPGCQSCHVGDANNQPGDTSGFIYADDQIRLLRAYRTGDPSATPIRVADSRFSENQVVNDQGQTVDVLYRLSKGHGGVMCEGCHGSTHAIWPNPNPNANDNIAATQIQGHAGTISECTVCHETDRLSASTQEGPHGMHLVDDRRFWREAHKDAAKRENGRPNGGSCGSCHGADHRGTVLSRTPVDRSWYVEGRDRKVAAGEPVGCDVCHSLSKSFDR